VDISVEVDDEIPQSSRIRVPFLNVFRTSSAMPSNTGVVDGP
jgi:hypothetical protein